MSPRALLLLPRVSLCLLALWLVGCSEEPPPAQLLTQRTAVAIPGPWDPPASTRSVAATQYVAVVDPPPVSPLGSCSSTNPFACSCTHPACTQAYAGTVALDQFLRQRYPFLSSGGLYCCRQNSANTSQPMLSVHAIGRAIDLMVPMHAGDADNDLGDQVANWLVENAEFIGVQRVIWDKVYWNGERGFGLLSSASSPHTNHIHLELSLEGAAAQTPFFTTGAVNGTCTPRCDAARLINADCSATDCAAAGTECLAGPPPTCGTPPPPEPPEATLVAGAVAPTLSVAGGLSRITFVEPRRLFDTRDPAASAALVRSDGSSSGPLGVGAANVLQDPAGFPAGTSAVWLNVAAIPGTGPGYVSIAPEGEPAPETSSVNYTPGFARANAAPVVVGANNGGLAFYAAVSPVDAVADLGAVLTPAGAGLTTAGPVRVLDTRSLSQPLLANEVREIDVQAPAGATGVVASVAAIAGPAAGFLSAFACGSPTPPTSNINFAADHVAANTVLAPLSNGRLCVWASAETHLVVDVTGYLSPDGALSYQALSPRRILDTRSETTTYTGRLGARQVIELPVQALPGIPAGAWAAVANLTVVNATEAGFLTAFPCGAAVPSTSSLNFAPSQPVGALTVSALSTTGSLCIFASSRAHLIVDLVGVWVHDTTSAPPPPPDPENPGDEGDPDGPVDPTDPGPMDPGEPSDPPDTEPVDDAEQGDTAPDVTDDDDPALDSDAADAGVVGEAEGACACRMASAGRARAPWAGAALLLFALLALRRRRVRLSA